MTILKYEQFLFEMIQISLVGHEMKHHIWNKILNLLSYAFTFQLAYYVFSLAFNFNQLNTEYIFFFKRELNSNTWRWRIFSCLRVAKLIMWGFRLSVRLDKITITPFFYQLFLIEAILCKLMVICLKIKTDKRIKVPF